MAVTASTRLGLTRWSAGADPFSRTQLDGDHATLDAKVAIFGQGTLASRPAPGTQGRFYWGTDGAASTTLTYDNGTAWLSHPHAIGDLPVAASGVSSATQLTRADDARLSDARTPTAHSHAIGDLPVAASGVSSALLLTRSDDARLSDARTPTAHSHPATDVTGTKTSAFISDFTEAAQDAVAALLASGTNVTLSYNDAGNSLTVTASGGDAELMRDTIGAAMAGVGLISVNVNDAADTITISTTATANSTDAALRDRSTHTGSQPTSSVTGLDTALAGKADKANGTHTGTTTIGGADTDVEKLRSVVLEVDGRAVTLTYNGDGTLATVVEKSGATTVKTTTLTYSAGRVATVAEAAGGQTATTTLTYDGTGTLTGTTRSVA